MISRVDGYTRACLELPFVAPELDIYEILLHLGLSAHWVGHISSEQAGLVPVTSRQSLAGYGCRCSPCRHVQEEEEVRLREEEDARKLEEAERRKSERKERRAEMKRQGLILTGKAKKEAERLAAFREQLLAQADSGPSTGQHFLCHASHVGRCRRGKLMSCTFCASAR